MSILPTRSVMAIAAQSHYSYTNHKRHSMHMTMTVWRADFCDVPAATLDELLHTSTTSSYSGLESNFTMDHLQV